MNFILSLFAFFAQIIGTIILIMFIFIILVILKVKKDTAKMREQFDRMSKENRSEENVLITNPNIYKNTNRQVIDYIDEDEKEI